VHKRDAVTQADPDEGLFLPIGPQHPLMQHRPFEMSVVHASRLSHGLLIR